MKTLLICAWLLIVATLSAQDRTLAIEDCFNPAFAPKTLKSIKWIPNSHRFSHVRDNSYLIATDPYAKTDPDDTLTSVSLLNTAILNACTAASMDAPKELKSMPQINWKDEYNLWFVAGNKLFTYNLATKTANVKRSFGKEYDALEVGPSSLNVATVEKMNIRIHTAAGSKTITDDGADGIVYGQSVHREEFGINGGLFWNTDGTKLAFYRMDERSVTKYPLLHINTIPASVTNIRYPMAGDSSHTVTIGVYNTTTESLIYLKTEGDYDQYLTNVTWSPDSDHIYVAWVNRLQNHMQLRKYNAETGELIKVIYEERSDKYVEPEHGPIFIPGSNTDFICFSERDGFTHLYLYENGKTPKQLTSGKWEVTRFVGFDKFADGIFFEGTRESPLERQAYYLRLKDRELKLRKITSQAGIHTVTINNNSNLFMDEMSSRKDPKKYTVFKYDGTNVNEVFASPNPLAEYKLGEVELTPYFVNGTALYTRTYYPPDFDKKGEKKYPVIVYVYNGPHVQLVTENWLGNGNLWFHYMAQNGYIVFTVDGRGSANRGMEFESATHHQLGTEEIADQIGALQHLKAFPYIDSNRIGVFGWSFGGFMTTSLMTRTPGVYKVGVAGGPVIDWRYYEVMYTERYMGTPQKNPEGFKKANLLNYTDNLEGRLLMIHGADDITVVWQHSLMYVQKMTSSGNANLDYYVYPGHEHNWGNPDKTHLYKKISQYFFDYL